MHQGVQEVVAPTWHDVDYEFFFSHFFQFSCILANQNE
jgi:hypothetical protein